MKTVSKAILVMAIILVAGVGLLAWKITRGHEGGLNKLSKEQVEMLLADENPYALKQLAEEPEKKKEYVEQIKEFLAMAAQARREGMADKPEIKVLLDFIKTQVVALSYDKEKNKDKQGQMPPLSLIKKEDTDAFYAIPANQEKFDQLFKTILAQSKEQNKEAPDPPEAAVNRFKEQFAKVMIYAKEAEDQKANLSEEFKKKTEFNVQLQQSTFLAQMYSQKVLAKKVKATDDEIKAYIAAHPEVDPSAKKAKAEELLQRAKNGEDFAKLADENTEDPGNKDPKTEKLRGGLYDKVKQGSMMPEFEKAALALQPGQIADQLVETTYGYHIIKLERKEMTKVKDAGPEMPAAANSNTASNSAPGQEKEEVTYDVRHILISTMYKDPANPFGQGAPVKDYVSNKIEEEKRKKLIDEMVAANHIEVAENFEVKVPEMPADSQMPMGMPQPGPRQPSDNNAPKSKAPAGTANKK